MQNPTIANGNIGTAERGPNSEYEGEAEAEEDVDHVRRGDRQREEANVRREARVARRSNEVDDAERRRRAEEQEPVPWEQQIGHEGRGEIGLQERSHARFRRRPNSSSAHP